MAQARSSTSTFRLIISKAWTGARFRPTGYLSNKTLGCILAQKMSRHRAMPADSWTKHLRNVKQVSEYKSVVIAHCSCHRLSSVVSSPLLNMKKMASQIVGKPFLASVVSGKISVFWYFPSLSVLKHMPLSKGSNSGPQASFLKKG